MRFHLRYAGTVGRWIAPGAKTSGSPLASSERISERIPPIPAPAVGSPARSRIMSEMSRSVTRSPGTSGRP